MRIRNLTSAVLSVALGATQLSAECRMQFGLSDEPFDYNPVTAYQRTQAALLASHLVVTLFRDFSSGTRLMAGATSYDVDSENSRLTFKINQSCGWSDGAPLTAQDYAAGLAYAMTLDDLPHTPGIVHDGTSFDIKALDATTLELGYEGSSEALLTLLGTSTFAPIPTHLGLSAEDYYSQALSDRVSSGPYMIWRQEEKILQMIANPFHCEGMKPSIDHVVIKSFATDEERMRAFVLGEVDLVRHAPLKQLQAVNDRRDDVDVAYVPSGNLGLIYLAINSVYPELQQPEVREAMALALDYRRFIETGSQQLGMTRTYSKSYVVPAGSVANPFVSATDISQENLAMAKSLMEEAGYSAENPLEVKIKTFPLGDYETTARQVASMLSRAYFRVEYEKIENVQASVDAFFGADYQTFVAGVSASHFDYAYGITSFSQDVVRPIIERAQQQDKPIPAPLQQLREELSVALGEIRATDDPQNRLELIHKAELLAGSSRLVLPLYTMQRNLVVHRAFEPFAKGFTIPSGFSAQYWTNTECEN